VLPQTVHFMNNKKLGRKNIFFERDVYFYAAMMHFLQKKKFIHSTFIILQKIFILNECGFLDTLSNQKFIKKTHHCFH